MKAKIIQNGASLAVRVPVSLVNGTSGAHVHDTFVGVRLPKTLLAELGLGLGDSIEVEFDMTQGKVIFTKEKI